MDRCVLDARLEACDAAGSKRETTSAGSTAGTALGCKEWSNVWSPDWQCARQRFGTMGSSPVISSQPGIASGDRRGNRISRSRAGVRANRALREQKAAKRRRATNCRYFRGIGQQCTSMSR